MSRSELAVSIMATVFFGVSTGWGWLRGSCADLNHCVGVRNCTQHDGCFATWVFTIGALIGALAVWTEVRERLKK